MRVSKKKSLRYTQDDSGEKVCILGGDNVGHCETEVHTRICLIPNGYRDIAVELQYRTFLCSCWGWLNSKHYKRKVDKRDARNLEATASVKKLDGQLRRISRDLRPRVAQCTEVDGGVFEQLL
jgi:hypothetical protein